VAGLVDLVLPLVLVVASVMRVSTPLLLPARTGRGQTAGRRRDVGPLATKAEAEVLAVRRATFISCRSSMLRELRKVGNDVRRGAMSATKSKRSSRPLMTLVTRSESETGAPTSVRASAVAFLLAVKRSWTASHTVLALAIGASAAVEVGMMRSTRSIAMEP
jgi:hypothetical protein